MSATASTTISTDVLVVGAGPTGLALASTLGQAGIETLIVDRLPAGDNTSRAAVIHAHTLEVLDRLGVAEQLNRAGLPLTKFSMRDRDRILMQLEFDKLPSPFAYLLMIPQDVTESILTRRLEESGSTVRRGWTVERIAEDTDRVRATVSTGDGPVEVVARYAVGADGMQSLVRRTAGIGFTGGSYEESFVLADIDMAWSHGRDQVMLFFSPAGLVVVAPLPGGRTRIVATLDDAPERPGAADIQALLDNRGPTRGNATVEQVHWSGRFRLHHRVADHYRRGRLFLVGDAAHVHSPAGGQGMNTGLVDACVLGPILAEVVAGRRDESYLDTYETLRRPAAVQVLKLAGRLTHMATMRSAPQRLLRNTVLSTLGLLPAARRKLQMNLSGLSRRAAARIGTVNGAAG